jgi:hypothetical protein
VNNGFRQLRLLHWAIDLRWWHLSEAVTGIIIGFSWPILWHSKAEKHHKKSSKQTIMGWIGSNKLTIFVGPNSVAREPELGGGRVPVCLFVCLFIYLFLEATHQQTWPDLTSRWQLPSQAHFQKAGRSFNLHTTRFEPWTFLKGRSQNGLYQWPIHHTPPCFCNILENTSIGFILPS